MNTPIKWTKIDSKNQKTEIDGVTYYAEKMKTPRKWNYWAIYTGSKINPIVSNDDLRTAKKEFAAWLEAQPTAVPTSITDADIIATQATKDVLAEDELARAEAQQPDMSVQAAVIAQPAEAHEKMATRAQIEAIEHLIAMYCPGRENGWFYRFTLDLLGKAKELCTLTYSEAGQVRARLEWIARGFCTNNALTYPQLALNLHYKRDLYPDDDQRATIERNECTRRFALIASKGRTNQPRKLTDFEAERFAQLVEGAVLLPTK